jgi:hypothetical protein
LCLVYPMLSVSLDCIFLIAPLVFSDVYLSCVLCTLCCQFLWIVYFWLPLWYSLTFICPVSCVPYVVRFSGLYIFDCPFGFLWRLLNYFWIYHSVLPFNLKSSWHRCCHMHISVLLMRTDSFNSRVHFAIIQNASHWKQSVPLP